MKVGNTLRICAFALTGFNALGLAGAQAAPPAVRDSLPTQTPGEKKQDAISDPDFAFPAKDRLFRLESEDAFRERLRQELPQVKDVQFPKDVPFLPEAKTTVEPQQLSVGPVSAVICYRPLYFEQRRTERNGRHLPCIEPVVSATRFYFDVLVLPYRMVKAPPWTFECDNR